MDDVTERLDAVNPFVNDGHPLFSKRDMRALRRVKGVEQKLLAITCDSEQPLARRFAAVEALFQGGWTGWRADPEARAVAAVMAEAIPADRMHNRWGVPGHFVGRSGRDLLSIEHGVEEALTPLLEDRTPLNVAGSEAATLAEGQDVSDLARYLLDSRR